MADAHASHGRVDPSVKGEQRCSEGTSRAAQLIEPGRVSLALNSQLQDKRV